jgi:UDP-N-acetylmuramoyl-L-alanyl-D-glutamate--2,6-diaminopimelate ligase
MNYPKQKKVVCIGIGGGGVYYVAKFFLALQVKVVGFDISKNERTQELEKLGAQITYTNPTKPLESDTTLFVYSPALPNEILKKLEIQNATIPHVDVREFTTELCKDYEKKLLSEKEIAAFVQSEISPLYTLDPSKMVYIGVTGSDGKTTTSTMIYHLLCAYGFKPALISTVAAKIGNKEIDTGFHTTTPSAQDLHKLLKRMEEENCTHAVIETTSHALAMGRIAGIKFDAIAYTNITSEHLDYHKTWENYFLAKASLLTEHTKKGAFVTFNSDNDAISHRLLDLCRNMAVTVKTYGENHSATIRATFIEETPTIQFHVDHQVCKVPVLGRYNVFNSLASITLVANVLKEPLIDVAKKLETFTPIVGRMQVLQNKPFTVIVDFAHTTNALDATLQAAIKYKTTPSNKLILVFGTAGKRDTTKRIPMGKVAGMFADITCLTAEDPRFEKLSDINDEVEKGWKLSASKKHVLIRFDDETLLTEVRRRAIETAIALAKPGDVVFIAGKAHEQSLAFGNVEYPWSDIEVTKQILEKSR